MCPGEKAAEELKLGLVTLRRTLGEEIVRLRKHTGEKTEEQQEADKAGNGKKGNGERYSKGCKKIRSGHPSHGMPSLRWALWRQLGGKENVWQIRYAQILFREN